MGKTYRKPKNVPVEKGNGYPQDDIGYDDVPYYGRMVGANRKKYAETRGTGAAQRGKKFLDM